MLNYVTILFLKESLFLYMRLVLFHPSVLISPYLCFTNFYPFATCIQSVFSLSDVFACHVYIISNACYNKHILHTTFTRTHKIVLFFIWPKKISWKVWISSHCKSGTGLPCKKCFKNIKSSSIRFVEQVSKYAINDAM